MNDNTVVPIISQDPYKRDTHGDLSKGRGNQESKAAWARKLESLAECQEEVLCVIAEAVVISGKEIANSLGKPFHTISGRITELLELGLIEKTLEVHDHSRCLRLYTGLPPCKVVIK